MPRLSSHRVALVTPEDLGLIEPPGEGPGSETVLTQLPPRAIGAAPPGFDEAVRTALR